MTLKCKIKEMNDLKKEVNMNFLKFNQDVSNDKSKIQNPKI